jgi:endonuclease-8
LPEGDTIATVARLLGPMLSGRRLVAARARDPRAAQGLVGKTITAVEALGKHLLIGLDDRTTLRIHLGMGGSWHRYDPGERWRFPEHLASLVLETEEDVLVCKTARTVERARGTPAQNPVRVRLGPNVLATEPDFDEMVRRTTADPTRTCASALLDQGVAAGIGNIWRNELLFRYRLLPTRLVGTDSSEVHGEMSSWFASARAVWPGVPRWTNLAFDPPAP